MVRRSAHGDGQIGAMKSIIRIPVITLVIFASLFPTSISADSGGIVDGVVRNGTSGGDVPTATPVALSKFVAGVLVEEMTSATDGFGAFTFAALEIDPQVAYQVTVEFEDATFSSVPFSFNDSDRADVEVTVYEITGVDPGVRFSRRVIVFTPQRDRGVRTLEILTIANVADHAYLPNPRAADPVVYSLPPGAFDFQVMWGMRAVDITFVENGMSLARPVSPGSNQLSFAYSFPWSPGGTEFRINAPFETVELVIMAPLGEMELSSGEIQRQDDVTIEGRELSVWKNVEPIPGGAAIVLSLSDPNRSVASRIGEIASVQWGLASLALAVGSLLVYSVLRYVRSPRSPKVTSKEERAHALLKLLAESEPGAEDDQRQAYKDELIELLKSDDQMASEIVGAPRPPAT